ncbi:general substrate transporter [Exidia glandulosa HHB12029]|uniref:General substrate transporter n=1 Tax=Exidia glandulosa HHB12029 TaxID=1314781 RepID=A0A165FG26_EXIGL|nr:general substrate transporter [Exidia glandulosa HHB12029]
MASSRTHSESDIKSVDIEKHEIGTSGLKHVEHVPDKAKVREAANAAYAAAVTQGNLNPWSKESFQLYGCALISFACSMGNGYDGSLMTSINAMDSYAKQFNAGGLGPTTGIIFSIYTIGQMAGSLFAGPICDRFGRRGGMFTGCLIIMCGTSIIATALTQHQFIAGRFVLGMGIAIAIVGAPTYCIEIAPPHWRGRMTALYNTGWNAGAIPAAAICLGTKSIQNNWAWRIPLIIQALPAFVVCCLVWFLPESPRWLFFNGRTQEATDFLVKFHGNNDPENPLVKLQLEEFKDNIKLDGSDKRWWDLKDLFLSHSARWRILMVFIMGLFGQMSGNGLGYFNVDIYSSLGFDEFMKFAMNLISTCLSALVAWIAVSLSDRMPRRKVLIIGTAVCSVMLACNAGLSAKWAAYGDGPKDLRVGQLAAAFFFLFNIAYGFTYTPLQSLYPAECLETTTRAKGISIKILVISATSFINLLCIPIALANIKWKLMIVFVVWDAFETVIWYFFGVETLGRTLEELQEIFDSPNPVKASLEKKKIAITNNEVLVVA